MATKQMTYAELAQVWKITPEAARKRVEGMRLPRQPGNDGKTRVLIDLDQTEARPPQPKSGRRPAGDDRAETESLRLHVATLRAETERLVAMVTTNRTDFERERERAEKAVADFTRLAERLADAERDRAGQVAQAEQAQAEASRARDETDAIRADLAAWKSRPWWRRALG